MPKYNIEITPQAKCVIQVKANSVEEALEKAKEFEMNDSIPHTWESMFLWVDARKNANDWQNAYIQECWKDKKTKQLYYNTNECEYKPSKREIRFKPGGGYSKNLSASLIPFGNYLLTHGGSLYPICPMCNKRYLKIDATNEYPRKHHTELCDHCRKK